MRRIAALVVCVGLCLMVGALGGWVTAGSVKDWYPTLTKPSFTPPNWLFGPVWTVLYVMMGVAAWRVWLEAWGDRARGPLTLFALQLALNLGWSVVFFGLHAIGAAVVVIVALEAAILGTMFLFRRIDGLAAALLVPYALWVAFATLLNVTIWRLNPS
ncbi:TspO/MBR family protein [Reyranella sp.]|jgi:translocator protein|uniref:TspO/MBR family protein n=1 Tax=Reyranella sp. TaxID=1929291 RepID=UPI003D09960E